MSAETVQMVIDDLGALLLFTMILIVAAGQIYRAIYAVAAQSLLGRQFRVTKQRGVPVESDLAPLVVATVHPSSILRVDDRDREAAMAAFVDDLLVVAKLLRS